LTFALNNQKFAVSANGSPARMRFNSKRRKSKQRADLFATDAKDQQGRLQ
jgi:hypothetical protein